MPENFFPMHMCNDYVVSIFTIYFLCHIPLISTDIVVKNKLRVSNLIEQTLIRVLYLKLIF